MPASDDAPQCLEIYAPFCLETPVSFETEAPSLEEMRGRIEKTLEFFPWLIADQGAGACWATRTPAGTASERGIAGRPMCRCMCEKESAARDWGRALYTSLFAILRLQGIYSVLAGITLPNRASVVLHEAMGLRPLGVYTGIGYKCSGWHDVGWWQCALRSHDGPPEEPIPFPAIRETAACASAIQAGVARG